jgi:hypothetical protein
MQRAANKKAEESKLPRFLNRTLTKGLRKRIKKRAVTAREFRFTALPSEDAPFPTGSS